MRELEQRTGVRREMIQLYFRNGLLSQPSRPKSNVAIYGEEHVRGILAIRRLQTERRLSIAEIRQALEGKSGPGPADAVVFQHLDELVAARLGADQRLVPLASVKARNPKAEHDAKVMHRIGAIRLVSRQGGQYLSHIDAQVVAIWGDMRAAGFTEENGFELEAMSMYVDAAKALARVEIKAYLDRVPRHYSNEQKAELARAGLTYMLSLFSLLRMKADLEEFRNSSL